MKTKCVGYLLLAGVVFLSSSSALAKRKGRNKKYYPPLTHPVVLWSRTLSESPDLEQRKIAAFKLSQYTQSIYQEEVVKTLLNCVKDTDDHIKVFCAKALGRATNRSKVEQIRKTLIEQYKNDAHLRGTLIRTFITRKDSNPAVQEILIESLKQSSDLEEVLPALDYFEQFGTSQTVEPLISVYNKSDNSKIKRGVVKALSERGQGQDSIITLLSSCLDSRDTTLVLTCLSALQVQAKKDSKTLSAVEKTIESSDPDVILATLELIQSLPESPNENISVRLVDLIEENSDPDVVEKSVLALGVCGDFAETTVKALQKLLEKKELEEGVRISAALSLGKQAGKFPVGPTASLSECKSSNANSRSLITACQLALQELQARSKKYQTSNPEGKSNTDKDKKSES
jgi:HEAT repeat protein